MTKGKHWKKFELDLMFEVIEEVLPRLHKDWTCVASLYNQKRRKPMAERDLDQIRNKFKALRNTKRPTGNTDISEDVLAAKRLHRMIKEKCSAVLGEDGISENEQDRNEAFRNANEGDMMNYGTNGEINVSENYDEDTEVAEKTLEETNIVQENLPVLPGSSNSARKSNPAVGVPANFPKAAKVAPASFASCDVPDRRCVRETGDTFSSNCCRRCTKRRTWCILPIRAISCNSCARIGKALWWLLWGHSRMQRQHRDCGCCCCDVIVAIADGDDRVKRGKISMNPVDCLRTNGCQARHGGILDGISLLPIQDQILWRRNRHKRQSTEKGVNFVSQKAKICPTRRLS